MDSSAFAAHANASRLNTGTLAKSIRNANTTAAPTTPATAAGGSGSEWRSPRKPARRQAPRRQPRSRSPKALDNVASDTSENELKGVHETGSTPIEAYTLFSSLISSYNVRPASQQGAAVSDAAFQGQI
jgi:hypothetical protein